jgi:flagellar M-ring protein FliF
METLRTFVRTLGPVRLAVLGGTTLALLGFFGWLITEASTPPQSLLYGGLDMADAAKVVAQLDATNVPYELGNGGTSVFVPADQVARTRIALAEQGLPSGGTVGYELFDKSNALGTTSFQQNVNLVRALEGELARTIQAIDSVKSARVHVVLPRRELFSRDKPEASASVLLQMRGRAQLTASQVAGIQQLIASAVPSLSPEHISIVDTNGTLLSENREGSDPVASTAAKADQRRRQLESQLSHTIEELVERTVGPGKVRAEVSLDMDFDRINTSEEIYDPDGQVVRSTQTVDHKSSDKDGSADAPVSVSTNLPDANTDGTSAQGRTSAESRSEETVNYEISKKVVNHVRETGVVKRLSVAVLLDGITATDADGNKTFQPRSAEQIEQLTSLVRSAVGFNAERGDTVEVVSMPFAEPEMAVPQQTGIFLGLEKSDFMQIAQYLALFVLAILVLLLVIRPIVNRAIDTMPLLVETSGGPHQGQALLPGQSTASALTGPDGQYVTGENGSEAIEEMIDIDRIDGRVKASSLKRVGTIVEKHPEESLAIIRSWLHAEQ